MDIRSRLTPSTFVAIPTDNYLTVDAYKAVSSSPVNKLPDITDATENEAQNILKIGKIDLANSKKMLENGAGKIKLDGKNTISNFLENNKGLVTNLQSVAKGIKDGLNTAKGYAKIFGEINGVVTKLKTGDLKSAVGIGRMLDSLSGSKFPIKITDYAGLSSFSTNLVREATALGIPGSFTAIAQGIQDKSILKGVARELIPDGIKDSTNGLLREIASSDIASDIKKHVPGFLGDLSGGYRRKIGDTFADSIRDFDVIKEIATNVDPNWNICRKSTLDKSINASEISRGSKDFHTAVKNSANSRFVSIDTSSPYDVNTSINTHEDKYMALVGMYGHPTVPNELRRNFPLVHITSL